MEISEAIYVSGAKCWAEHVADLEVPLGNWCLLPRWIAYHSPDAYADMEAASTRFRGLVRSRVSNSASTDARSGSSGQVQSRRDGSPP